MKNFAFIIACCSLLPSCASSKFDYGNSFWGELEEDQNYLYKTDNLSGIVDGELNSGSIVLLGMNKGDFQEVRLTNLKSKKVNRYLYKPKYKKLGPFASNYSQKLNRPSIDYSRSYLTGEKGGCYYLNSNGNRVYVDRAFCKSSTSRYSASSTKSYNSSRYKSSSGNTYVKGHYRKTKSGKTIYVKPHTRKKY